MKLLIFFYLVIANISNNGKASLESFSPNDNVLFTDTTKSSDKSCHRPCKFNVKPRQCYFSFDVGPVIDDERPALAINGLTPGPSLHVCLHDIIIVQVRNRIPDQDLSIHWNGLEQRGTPYMDGVPMITQCSIAYGSTYKYSFRASKPGTFFYHADSVSQQSDGVYGSLIVDQPQPLEPHSSLYDYDRSKEHTLIFGARFPELISGSLDTFGDVKPNGVLINGKDSAKLFVIPSYSYRLRFINAIAVECPLVVGISEHLVTVVATDGKPVQPIITEAVKLYPGERMDVVVRADRHRSGYWLQVKGEGVCAQLSARAMFIYSGFNYTSLIDYQPNSKFNIEDSSTVKGQDLLSYKQVPPFKNVRSVYLGIDKNMIEFKETDNDFRYVSDVVPKKPFFPAALSLQNGVVQINGKNFLFPDVPYLLKPREVRSELVCEVGNEKMHRDPQCLQLLTANVNEVLELILVNEGAGSNDTYTFHMHGYAMQVLATWQSPAGLPLSRTEFEKLDKEGLIDRNLQNPPVKNSVMVPNKGFTIVRINPEYGGSWMFECRSCALSSLPVAILISVPQPIPKIVVDSLPTCASYRPADVLLN
ncbi:unnamed protein product [Leptidea sinapis]|uniref:Plastocyanin-like domain-containing protein n=1 Tax=Leptidea sinapis TaxID=189913 RepID=A0A5E4QCY7_9NEOP|nr:unnamed protein product [Leptidea sinapis]